MITLPTTGLSNDTTNTDYISNDRDSDSTIYLHEDENNRKSYPQRNNRAKLNYRDIERGMYEEIRQSMWALGGPRFTNRNNRNDKNNLRNHDDDVEIIDLSIDDDDDDNQKSTDNNMDQMYRRLWCICKKPWDHSRVMLRCDLCANWYHGDCMGVSKEEAKVVTVNGDQFICPSCRGKSHSKKSSEESILKRKHLDSLSSANDHQIPGNEILSTSTSYNEPTKRPKPNNSFHQNSSTESQTNCIVHGCNNWAKSGWVYCSPACIRRHINDRLQAIQESKGMDDVDIPTSDDILLYEYKSKKILEKNLVPKIEDLCTWINQHPSYEIIKPALRQTILLTAKQSTQLAGSSSAVNRSKPKTPLISAKVNQKTDVKSVPNKKSSIQRKKPINNKTSNVNNTDDLRSKVLTTLYDKIIIRLEKNGEKDLMKLNIRTIVKQIEEEMFRVYGKVDNSYKNKFRSLLANITNMNNNFFYKQILSKELSAKDIVAMKSEDMLPPEEKEKRKDQFEKEIQMIINAEQQKAEEMARRVRMKVTRQGLVDNDAIHLPVFNSKEQNSSKEEVEKSKDNQLMNTPEKTMEIKPATSKSILKVGSDNQTSSKILSETLPSTSLIKKIDSNEPLNVPIAEQSNPMLSTVDLDNDYIEPESPTGVDALIYDEDDNDDDDINVSSRPSTNHSPIENTEFIPPYQQIIRDDYNPSKAKNETTPISQSTPLVRLPNQWRGVIHPSDTKILCQSVHIYGENDYLIGHIPEQLVVLGRLRLGDLWDYIRESLTVRDVLILTLISSSLNTNDHEIFSQYVDTIRTSGRAAVINKCTNSSLIRDMYVLAADTKECPPSVLSSLFLPITFESKQLFLVIIGSGKRTIKSINRSNENQLVYKPIALKDLTATRDPRLLRNKDPRLNRSNTTVQNITLPTQQLSNTKQTSIQYSNDDLHKLTSDSLERIRHSSTADGIRSIVMSTMEILKANKRDDLCADFNERLRTAMIEWQTKHGNTSISIPTIVAGDNLIEENMDVDDDQDDKHKKQITPTSTFNSTSEFSDIDHRFRNQDTDHPMTTTNHANDHRKQRRKSRFSDLVPTEDVHRKKSKSNISIEKMFSNKEKEKSALINTDFRINNTKIESPKLEDQHINSSLSSKFRPIIYSTESFIPSINTKDNLTSKPIQFSFSKDSFRQYKPNNNNDMYENSSPTVFEDLIKQVQSYDYQSLAFSNDNWIKQTLPINPIRSTAMLNLILEQHKTKNKFSSGTNEWKSNSSNNNYMTHYHDFDQPQE